MLKQVEVTNRRGMTLSLEMEENESGYQINGIDGLDPPKATLVSSSFAEQDGEEFQSAHLMRRDIKIGLDLHPDFVDETYTSLRKKLRTYFMPKTPVKLRFILDTGLYLDIQGIVENHDSSMFSTAPGVVIGVACFKPDLIDPRIVSLAGSTVSTSTPTVIDYLGDVETGTILTLNVNRTMSGFTIYNNREDGTMAQLDFAGSLLAGDVLVVSSLRGNKGITLTRGGISSSYLYGRPYSSDWIDLMEGLNQFRVYAPGASVPYVLEYQTRYGGI
jgi:tail protein